MTKIRNWLIGIAAVCLLIGSMLLLPWGKDTQKVYAAEAPAVSVRGDLNADGVVNLDDVIILRQYLAGMIELTDEQMEAGDVYGSDAEITLDDVIVMRQYLAGIQVEGGIGEPMEHVHTIVYHEGKPATCTEAGWEPYETCTECDYTTYQEIAPLEHDLIEHEAKPASCTEAGWDAYVTCTRCDYTTYQEIAAKGHAPAEAVRENEKAATCTEAGSYDEVVYCSVCGIELSRESKTTAKLDHDLVEHEAKPATCTEPGWDAYVTCTRCDYTTYQEIAALDHAYEEAEIVTEPTCESDGVRKLSCARCGDVVQEAIPAIDHNIQNNKCTMCGRELPGYYNGTYGYEFLGTMDKGDVRQSLYEDIDVKVKSFHVSTYKDAPEDLILASVNYASLGLRADEAISVWKTYKDDNPLYYWLSNTTYVEEGGIVLLVDEAYAEAEARENYNQLIDAKVQEYSAQLYDGANAYDIALAYHDAILYAVDYTYDENNEPEDASWAHNVLGVFAGQGAVCEAYARTFQLLLNYSGIENVFVTGDGNGEEHAWNLVRLDDGNWYWCDLTWDDTFVGGLNSNWKWGISYNYFMVNDTQNTLIAEGGWNYGEEVAFLENHTFDAATNAGVSFLYDLPARGQDVYTSGSLMLRDEIVVDDMLLQVVGYNALELHKITVSGSFDIPEAVQYNGREMRIISLGSGDSEQISGAVTSITIPESVIFIWDSALGDDAIGNIYVDANNPKFTSQDGVLFTKSLYTLIKYPSANIRTEYIIPDETHILADGAFSLCANLSTLTFGKNVEGVGMANWGGGYRDGEADGFGGSYVTGGISGTYNALTGDRQIIIDSENKSYASDDFAIYNYSKTTILYIYDKTITTYQIPSTVTNIALDRGGSDVFSDCYMLEYLSVEPGNSVYCAFEGIVYNKNMTEIITVPKGLQGDVVIPDSVTSLGAGVFSDCGNITSIYIPDSITSIESSAFSNCHSLTAINIPDGLTSIERLMFSGCSSLTNIMLPAGVESIGRAAFSGCSGLTDIIIPDSVTRIGAYAFNNCSSLKSVVIPKEVIEIEDWVFAGCNSLQSINIQGEVISIGSYAFYNCSGLKSIFIPNSVVSIGSNAFYNCSSLTSITIPSGVTNIESSAFYNCSSLTSITIPSGVTNIESSAFYNCSGLIDVNIPNSVTTIGYDAFWNCDNLTIVNITDLKAWCNIMFENYGSNPIYYANNLYLDGQLLSNLIIPEGVTNISDFTFHSCSGLTSVTLPTSLEYIADSSFFECYKLVEIYNHSELTIIKRSTDNGWIGFYAQNIYTPTDGETQLSSTEDGYIFYTAGQSTYLIAYTGEQEILNLPIDIKYSIYEYAFYNNQKVQSIIIPDNVMEIGYSAFASCSALENVRIGSGVQYIADLAFYGCEGLESIVVDESNSKYRSENNCLIQNVTNTIILGCKTSIIPENIQEIGEYAFAHCKELDHINIPNAISKINDFAFYQCSGLTSVIIPQSVTFIGDCAFLNCEELEEVIISEGLIYIGDSAFANCMSLSEILIPNSVKNIGDSAFRYCSKLKEIHIPDGVEEIADFAFVYCINLRNLIIGSGVKSIGASAFSNCSELSSIIVEEGNSVYYSEGNCLIETATQTLLVGCVNSIIPEGVARIGEHAFSDCNDLTSITIPEGVVDIGEWAFANCQGLNSVIIPNTVKNIAEYAFYGCSSLSEVMIPEGVLCIADSAFDMCQNLSGDLVIPDSVVSLGDSVFECCDLLCVTIGNGVKNIEASVFDSCHNLLKVSIGESVTSIGNRAFYHCYSLISLIVNDGVTSIGLEAFLYCYDLREIKFQDTEGWYVTENVDDVEGIEISSEDLSDPAKAAELLKDTYSSYYWKKH